MSTPAHTSAAPTTHEPFDFAESAALEMQREGFDLSPVEGSDAQLAAIIAGHVDGAADHREDLRSLSWSSIDNDSSRDLDQVEWAETIPGTGAIRVRVGIADVAATVAQGSPIDLFAQRQSQTVYTAVRNFPMLPFALSTGLTSLNPAEDRNALVAEFVVAPDGGVTDRRLFAASVHNNAQLAYSHVGPWLNGDEHSADSVLNAAPAVQLQVRLQDEAAQRLRAHRQAAGALDFRRAEAMPVVADGKVMSLESAVHNRAMDMIEDLMIAANETVATALSAARRSGLRRVVKNPERWQRIVDLVHTATANLPQPVTLPAQPDAKALNEFLCAERDRNPDHYPDLALAIIKLMGAGEYVLARGDDPDPPGHFALAAQDYAHSTAPNRRFADLVTQRVVHAMLANAPAPYTDDELAAIALHCNERDKAARKVERAMLKRAQAQALSHSIGHHYKAIVTGAGPKGIFVRVLQPPVEGMLVHGGAGLDVGDRVNVTLVHTDAAKAFIDFARV
ncbi:RNB domain-containing ribonuclease [Terriglobus roseus]|uniref:RNB domain-containing ribonuclease n=1 Tax=Terriglobus roseus TaxID=392734 RepID=UPI001FE2236A|nr:RNB domain-containing ribonuclease [Terriglobus roseus]